MNPTKDRPIKTWPPTEKPAQVTREQLKQMTAEAINAAREAGALADIMTGKDGA
jgi:hypothetical protein